MILCDLTLAGVGIGFFFVENGYWSRSVLLL